MNGAALSLQPCILCAAILRRLVPSPHPFDFKQCGDIYNISFILLVIGIILYYSCGDIIIYISFFSASYSAYQLWWAGVSIG